MQNAPEPDVNQGVQQRVNLRVMSARRTRVMLQVALLLTVSAGLVIAVMFHRDQLAVDRCRRGADAIVAALDADVKARRPLPMALPIDERVGGHFHYSPLNSTLFGMGKPVGVCCCTSEHNLFLLRPKGRHVVLYNGESLEVRWVSEAEFEARAAEWNLNPPRIP